MHVTAADYAYAMGMGQTTAPTAPVAVAPVAVAPVAVAPVAVAPVAVAPVAPVAVAPTAPVVAPVPAPVVAPAAPAYTPQPAEVVRAVFDSMLMSMATDSPATYTRPALYALRDEAVRRGVSHVDATNLVRQETWRRLFQVDPNPGADLDELSFRLGGSGYPQPVYQQPVYAPPVYQQPVYAHPPTYAPAPRRSRRRRDEDDADPVSASKSKKDWMPTALAVGAGILGTLLIVNLMGKN